MPIKNPLTALAGSVLIVTLAACGGSGSATPDVAVAETPEFESGTTMAELSEAGSIRIGTKYDQPGFGLLGLEDEPEGFDVEIGKIIAGAMGIAPDKIEWVETPSDVREQVLEDGDVDMVVATYTINDERKQRVTFAGPYYVVGQSLMVAADNDTIEGPEDLKDNPDAKVCSATGTAPADNIEQYLASKDQLVLFDVYEKCADALRTGQVDVVTTDNAILAGFVANAEDQFKLVGEPFTEEPWGIGVTKGDIEFCEFINDTLADNQDAYSKAWDSTAGQIEGAQDPELPELAPCA
ncbi:glutamate ABC transporter substrate-binding protein [Nocardioides marmotae]|uniref:glutamate ABC transporter substrate-binding protein n=1 Tax=Nocardioides marmotae TaxID=2663857 RepID=UPI0012B5E097|nr:glutamate ABC transporter substrate-binding protein [Nocardioides marmotae]MBC9733850.1 glutamate ABC transporter substrate-binding protein [Nocardioides marmotae]MTB84952.1 transporter substrate-binding domain-containing protein [Nocardioides marmotae]